MVKFGYFVIPGVKTRYAVAAVEKVVSKEYNMVDYEVAFSFCSAQDHFNKKRGRTIAEGRLHSNKCIVLSYPKDECVSTSSVLHDTLFFAVNNNEDKTLPSWFVRAYKSMRLLWGLKSLGKPPTIAEIMVYRQEKEETDAALATEHQARIEAVSRINSRKS
jgi:hypothetical protein